MLSRSPVFVTLPVEAVDCDLDGRLRDTAVERLFERAAAAYFEQCASVDATALELQKTKVQLGGAPGARRRDRRGERRGGLPRPLHHDGEAATRDPPTTTASP